MVRLRPRRDHVLVKRDADLPERVGKIYIPEIGRDFRSQFGTAISCGPKCRTVKPKDRLFLPVLGGVEFRHEGELLAIFPEDEIYGVIE